MREHFQPGDCFYTDGSNPRPRDCQGNTYARLGVCAATSYGLISFSDTKGTESLVQHLVELEEHAMKFAGRRPSVIRMDFGSEAFRQSHGDDVLVTGLKTFLSTRPGVRIIAIPPRAQYLNKAENAWGILLALCLKLHIRANLGAPAWRIVMRGAIFLYNRHPAPASYDPDGAGILRLKAFTGRTWDASTMICEVGQSCFVQRHGMRRNLIEPLVEPALYISPGFESGGHVVHLFRNDKPTIVQHATPTADRDECSAALVDRDKPDIGHLEIAISSVLSAD